MVDKCDKYSYLFNGLRKNKFVAISRVSFSKFSENELSDVNLFFITLYELKDIFELFKVCRSLVPIIIASENIRILKRLRNLDGFIVLDLSKRENSHSGFYECINQVFI